MVKVLVTGANGQLGQALQFVAPQYPGMAFSFRSSRELDITDPVSIHTVFTEIAPDFCINAAAYTAVDKAESEPKMAYRINAEGARNMAGACRDFNTVLLHVSTDFVFDGTKKTPYTEDDTPNPQSVYGQTKWEGERLIKETWPKHYIVRTSWVYSQFGHNFLKTMLRLADERDQLGVVDDQIGTPTNAVDLAQALVAIIEKTILPGKDAVFGTYHFSNEGQCSWYGFAHEIFHVWHKNIQLNPINTEAYPTPAKRPAYSVMEKGRFFSTFTLGRKDWKDSLRGMFFI